MNDRSEMDPANSGQCRRLPFEPMWCVLFFCCWVTGVCIASK